MTLESLLLLGKNDIVPSLYAHILRGNVWENQRVQKNSRYNVYFNLSLRGETIYNDLN